MENKDENENSWYEIGGFILTIVLLIWGAVAFMGWVIPTQMERELDNYRDAVELCGEHNVMEHNYTNGSTDFNCIDYSLIVKK